LTANTQTENLVEGFNVGGVDYITKPFRREELWVRVNTHLELSESRQIILEMNRSRDRLYSIIAHDVRSPLSGILQTLEAIDQGYIGLEGDELKEIIKLLKERTKETSTLLNSLLQWTRIQTSNQQLEFKETDLFVLIQSCIDLLRPNAEQKQIDIKVEVEEELKAWCDELSVHTVVRNLLSNAIKFTQKNGAVRICASQKEQEALICVSDNGIGMSPETIERIFAKDQHYTSSGTENEQGTGLGLMLVKEFVKKNKGRLEVDSEPDKGTEFRVFLPLKN
jgi:two-component system sensor histidine kinase/response regulator